MGILPAFTFFGIDIFGFLRQKPQQSTVLSQISTLQTFHSLTTEAQDPKIGTAEEEVVDVTRAIAQRIGEKEILAVGSRVVSQKGVEEFVKNATFPDTKYGKEELVDLENLLDVPKTVVDVVMEQ